jgi:hypothetical protein
MKSLSDYLDTEEAISVTDLIREKLNSVSPDELEEIVSRFKLNPKIGSLFYQCSANVEAVRLGRTTQQTTDTDMMDATESSGTASKFQGRSWVELSRFIPLRLTTEERRILAILDRTLKVSEYTDNVDIYVSRSNRAELIRSEIAKIHSVLSGQYIAMKMTKNIDFLTAEWFGTTFEIGRRYKAMNPDRLRDTWVKMMYMLQDSRCVGEFSESAQVEMKTVATALADAGLDKVAILSDILWDKIIFHNDKASEEMLMKKFGQSENIQLIIDSIKDYYAEIMSFVNPIDTLIGYLSKYFSPNDRPSGGVGSLAIRAGENGARLSHSHQKQYQYVLQSLKLWREVLFYFMPIWIKAETDVLSHDYRLADTGQGLNRVQSAPQAASLMNSIVSKVSRELDGNWIGSSVVHMGDHNVPNALMFLDKYCQISRILGPIAHTLNQLEKEYNHAPSVIRSYIDENFGGVESARKLICCDFFKHGFDGSGADNNYDAGSCIDGRLTSAWNWCSKIEKKPFFPLFLLTNFVGFDGQQGW